MKSLIVKDNTRLIEFKTIYEYTENFSFTLLIWFNLANFKVTLDHLVRVRMFAKPK